MHTSTLVDSSVVVTGASAGIGRATAERAAMEGANLVLAARRKSRLEELAGNLAAEYDVEVIPIPTDVRDESAVDDLVSETVETFGGLDVLVCNAGVGRGDDVETMSTEQYRTMQETNVDGTFFATRAALPHLRRSSGNLIFVGSFAAKYPRPFNPVYAATKWWVRGFAHSVMGQVGGDDVGVSVVNPSEVRTEFGAAEGTPFEERFEEGEVVEPEEVAEAIVFAAKQDRVTTSEIDVNRRDKFEHF